MNKLSQILILLLFSETLYASSHHRGSFDIELDKDVTQFLCDTDITLYINSHDQHIIHDKIVENAPDIKTVGTIIHVAGIISSNKALETVGTAIEHLSLHKAVHSKTGNIHFLGKDPSIENESPCPPNTPTKKQL